MARRTKKFRELLERHKKAVLKEIDKFYYSVEVMLDNVDQEYEQRRTAQNNKAGEYENKDQAKSSSRGAENKSAIEDSYDW